MVEVDYIVQVVVQVASEVDLVALVVDLVA